MKNSEISITSHSVIFLSHGSPDLRSSERMESFARVVEERTGWRTYSAYLDHNQPTLREIASLVKDAEALVVPMLLTKAFHAKFDVPRSVQEAGLKNVLEPIGHPLEILESLLRRANQSVVFVAVGTSDAEAQRNFEDAVQIASRSAGIHATHAYVTGRKDLLGEVLDRQENSNCRAVIPWMFAEGKLLDTAIAVAKERNIVIFGGGLCSEEIFIQHICAEISAALSTFSTS